MMIILINVLADSLVWVDVTLYNVKEFLKNTGA